MVHSIGYLLISVVEKFENNVTNSSWAAILFSTAQWMPDKNSKTFAVKYAKNLLNFCFSPTFKTTKVGSCLDSERLRLWNSDCLNLGFSKPFERTLSFEINLTDFNFRLFLIVTTLHTVYRHSDVNHFHWLHFPEIRCGVAYQLDAIKSLGYYRAEFELFSLEKFSLVSHFL